VNSENKDGLHESAESLLGELGFNELESYKKENPKEDSKPLLADYRVDKTKADIKDGFFNDREEIVAPAFEVSNDDRVDRDDLLKDPTDFSDLAAEKKVSQTWKITAIIVSAVLILAGSGFLGVMYVLKSPTANVNVAPEVSTDTTSTSDSDTPSREGSKPLLDAFSSAPVAVAGPLTATAKDSSISLSSGKTLTITGSTLNGTQVGCSVDNPTDFCLASVSDIADVGEVSIYLLKDAAHSRFFEDPESFTKKDIAGSEVSAIINLSFGNQKKQALVSVLSDSSGFMMILPDNVTDTQIQKLISSIKLV
jgi:hypothetical protein